MSGLASCRLEIGETAATIAAEPRHIPSAVGAIADARAEIERQIAADPFFLTTFEPYDRRLVATGGVTERMCGAAEAAGVGPMATVAGAVAEAALEAMVRNGCDHGWVDNGGDIALLLSRPTVVEVFSGSGQGGFGLEVGPTDGTIGICSSSGKLGHSISLGSADASVVIATSATLADALATAIGNRVRTAEDLRTCFDRFEDADGFVGAIVVLDGDVGIAGRVPKVVEVEHNHDRLTVHSTMPPGAAAARLAGMATVGQEVIQ